ncbi:hypothetical protein PGH47_41795 [Streptomyces sp. HUAS 31]|uniref:hypothetical protein n=1 Tax=Streptomyces sp. HUAS 31 TaxID=3020055 RepID=UPI0023054CB9|nr:hypothetical protein [Streptomyces sp. HUAS 31]WCE02375.1 hypothetical protein PGH47_41795 [Streptomyces sp. HUAS 31]
MAAVVMENGAPLTGRTAVEGSAELVYGLLWAGSQPTQLALTGAELMSFGVRAPREVRVDEALVRVGTGAELVGVPESELRLYEGVGALLRYTAPGAPS